MRKITLVVPVTFTILADEGVSAYEIASSISVSAESCQTSFDVEDADITNANALRYEATDSR